jgi:hypothetical protein
VIYSLTELSPICRHSQPSRPIRQPRSRIQLLRGRGYAAIEFRMIDACLRYCTSLGRNRQLIERIVDADDRGPETMAVDATGPTPSLSRRGRARTAPPETQLTTPPAM